MRCQQFSSDVRSITSEASFFKKIFPITIDYKSTRHKVLQLPIPTESTLDHPSTLKHLTVHCDRQNILDYFVMYRFDAPYNFPNAAPYSFHFAGDSRLHRQSPSDDRPRQPASRRQAPGAHLRDDGRGGRPGSDRRDPGCRRALRGTRSRCRGGASFMASIAYG